MYLQGEGYTQVRNQVSLVPAPWFDEQLSRSERYVFLALLRGEGRIAAKRDRFTVIIAFDFLVRLVHGQGN